MTDVPLPFPPPEPAAGPVADPEASVRRPADTATDGPGSAARAVAATLARETGRDALHDGRRTSAPPAVLTPFVEAGVLAPADVHVATALARLLGEADGSVLLGAALAVRAPRRQHVCVDLATVRESVVSETAEERRPLEPGGHPSDDPVADLGWPEPTPWRAALAASPLVVERDPLELELPDDAGVDVPPLVLAGTRLYLDRYWRHERRVAQALAARATRTVDGIDLDRLRADLRATQPDTGEPRPDNGEGPGSGPDRQQVAIVLAVTRRLAIVAGGPGTGKTTTVARILRLLDSQAEATGAARPVVALAAPTGKAAARLTESLRAAADHDDPRLGDATATTMHRLLGSLGGHGRRFRHGPGHPLPHDVVIVDETSMVDLPLLAQLLSSVREDARVILLGDPHQLASVEAGSVLGDVVGDPTRRPVRSASALVDLRSALGDDHLADTDETDAPGLHDALVVLDRVHRFEAGAGIDRFATAVRTGDVTAALHHLDTATDLHWVRPQDDVDGIRRWRRTGPTDAQLADVHDRVVATGQRLRAAADAGDGAAALASLDDARVLCAHRRGEPGVAGWTARIEAWLADAASIEPDQRWYLGRPVLVTTNDRRLQLWNGDLGVVVRSGEADQVAIAFPALDGDGVRYLAPSRVGEVETVHAMTVHKSQGSQVGHAIVVLPDPASRICTRELLYTAVTRARTGATIVGSEAALRATIAARTQRASGLGVALGR